MAGLKDVGQQMNKNAYIAKYKGPEGIELSKHDVSNNPGLRYIAKNMLNSLWGKFGQVGNKTQTEIFGEGQLGSFTRKLKDSLTEMSNFVICNNTLITEWKYKKGAYADTLASNLFIASNTTAMARMKLYKSLDTVKERMLYCDTDSIIYLEREGELYLPLGNLLGEFTNELRENDYITIFISGGAKNDGFVTAQGHESCKVRSFTLNFENAQMINFHTMNSMLHDDIASTIAC